MARRASLICSTWIRCRAAELMGDERLQHQPDGIAKVGFGFRKGPPLGKRTAGTSSDHPIHQRPRSEKWHYGLWPSRRLYLFR